MGTDSFVSKAIHYVMGTDSYVGKDTHYMMGANKLHCIETVRCMKTAILDLNNFTRKLSFHRSGKICRLLRGKFARTGIEHIFRDNVHLSVCSSQAKKTWPGGLRGWPLFWMSGFKFHQWCKLFGTSQIEAINRVSLDISSLRSVQRKRLSDEMLDAIIN